MKDMIFNQKLLIGFGIFFFAVAFLSSLLVEDYRYDNWFRVLPFIGKLAVFFFCADLIWILISQFIKKR